MEQQGVFRPRLVFRPKPQIILFGDAPPPTPPSTEITASNLIYFGASVSASVNVQNSASSAIVFAGSSTGFTDLTFAITGVAGSGLLSSVSVQAGPTITVGILGVLGTSSLGTASVGLGQTPIPTTVAGTGAVGTCVITVASDVTTATVLGIQANFSLGNINIWSAVPIGDDTIWTDITI